MLFLIIGTFAISYIFSNERPSKSKEYYEKDEEEK